MTLSLQLSVREVHHFKASLPEFCTPPSLKSEANICMRETSGQGLAFSAISYSQERCTRTGLAFKSGLEYICRFAMELSEILTGGASMRWRNAQLDPGW